MTTPDPLPVDTHTVERCELPAAGWLPAITLRLGAVAALDSLMPPACLLCGDAQLEGKLCRACENAVLHTWPPKSVSCRFCGMPRPSEPVSALAEACPLCKSAVNIHRLDQVIALAIYQGAVREAVVAAKLAKHTSLAGALGRLLGDQAKSQLNDVVPDRVTFVPTHLIRRIQRRGLSGAAAMAGKVAESLGVPCQSLLTLTRHVHKQSLLPDAERPKNVSGAFALKKSYAWPRRINLRDQHILLVDDVLTTGSTASEIANVLKAAGAARVTLAVVARAVRH